MKKMKRFISLLMAVSMLLTVAVFTLPVSAADVSTVEVTDEDWLLVEKLEALGAITNEYEEIGAFVTRRQMADIIAKYLRLQTAGTNGGKSPFLDVAVGDASIDNIVALYSMGIITGDNELKFHPDNYLTYDEAIVFVVSAVGHKMFAIREGGFPTGYHRIAIKSGMLEGLKFNSGKDNIPLCDVYKMLESALRIGAVMDVGFTEGQPEYYVSDTDTFLSNIYNITEYKGIVTGTELTHLNNAKSYLTDEQVEIDGVIYDTPGYVYETSLGRAVYYYVRKTNDGSYDVAYVEENDKVNHITKVDSDDILPEKTTASRIYYRDEDYKDRHIDFSANVDVIFNGKCYRGYGALGNVLPASGYIEALDNTGDKIADVLFVYEYDDMVIGVVDTYDEIISAMFPEADTTYKQENLSDEDNMVRIRLMPEDKGLSIGSLTQWDVASIMKSKGTPKLITVYISRTTITGTVDEFSSENGYRINGEYFKLSKDYKGSPLTVGTGATFYMNHNKEIVAMKRDATSAIGTYAVLTGINYKSGSISSELQLRLFTVDGEHITAPLKESVNIDNTRYKMPNQLTTIANYLTGGYQVDGTYAIETPYVVRYVISGDGISYLDTGKTGEEGNLTMIASDNGQRKNRLLYRTSGFLKEERADGTTFYPYFRPNNTIIFFTPEKADLANKDGYNIVKTLPAHKYYWNYDPTAGTDVNGRTPEAFDIHTESYQLYNLGTDGVPVAEVILFVGAAQGTAGTNSASLRVVTKVTSAVNNEGNATGKVYLDDETISALFAQNVSVSQGGTALQVTGTAAAGYLAPGMVVKYTTNTDGEIASITILSKYSGSNVVAVTGVSSKEIINTNADYTMLGEVTAIDVELGLLSFNDGTRNQMIPIRGTITEYRNSTQKAKAGTASSIAIGDQILVDGTSYYSIQQLIVFKD